MSSPIAIIVCPTCSPEAFQHLSLVARADVQAAMMEVDPIDGWRQFRPLVCDKCQTPMLVAKDWSEGSMMVKTG